MLKDLFKKSGNEDEQKRKMENIVVFIIILIITVLVINSMWSKEKESTENKVTDSSKVLANADTTEGRTEEELEDKLADILETINGVGKVKVLIKYSESSSVVAMYNETSSESNTEENTGNGGSKNVKETENKKEIVYTDEDGKNVPITEKVVMPVVEGAIITAQGAGNANVKSSIVSAVEAVTGLAVHKIQVFEMGG